MRPLPSLEKEKRVEAASWPPSVEELEGSEGGGFTWVTAEAEVRYSRVTQRQQPSASHPLLGSPTSVSLHPSWKQMGGRGRQTLPTPLRLSPPPEVFQSEINV